MVAGFGNTVDEEVLRPVLERLLAEITQDRVDARALLYFRRAESDNEAIRFSNFR